MATDDVGAPICYGCEHCGCDVNDPDDFCEVCDECDPCTCPDLYCPEHGLGAA